MARRAEFKPYKVTTPVTVDISFKNYTAAETLAFLPMFERTGRAFDPVPRERHGGSGSDSHVHHDVSI